MSRYVGNADECPTCKLTYGRFRTGFTYQDIWLMFYDSSDDPADWKYKTRGVILGKWFQIKQEMWEQHKFECAKQAAFDKRKRKRKRARK